MDSFEIAGNVRGTVLRLAPGDDGRLTLSVLHENSQAHGSVILTSEYLLPLASWFAGEAWPGIVGHGEYGTPYGRWLTVGGDEAAVVYGTHTQARLECRLPFGTATVSVGPRDRRQGVVVMLSPDARQDVARWLRHIDAQGWTHASTS